MTHVELWDTLVAITAFKRGQINKNELENLLSKVHNTSIDRVRYILDSDYDDREINELIFRVVQNGKM